MSAGEPCRNPACGAVQASWRDPTQGWCGYCPPCYLRWADHGRPLSGPPEPHRRHAGLRGTAAGRAEDYFELRGQGLTVAQAAERIGVVRTTAYRYEARQRAGATLTIEHSTTSAGITAAADSGF